MFTSLQTSYRQNNSSVMLLDVWNSRGKHATLYIIISMRQWPVTLILLASKSHIKVTVVFSPGSFDRTFGYHGNSKYGSILLQKKKKNPKNQTKNNSLSSCFVRDGTEEQLTCSQTENVKLCVNKKCSTCSTLFCRHNCTDKCVSCPCYTITHFCF